MSKTAIEKRTFKAHSSLLMDVITRQAGTLDKAILEGVMNSIDAKANRIDVTISEDRVVISDDGKGFKSRDEIVKVFEIFGEPQTVEKTYGVFRVGRGQLFAFGANVWRTGPFRMAVDIKRDGLDYELHEDGGSAPGCEVTITLYDSLSKLELRTIEDSLRDVVRYAPVPITINGKALSSLPEDQAWDCETPEAYFRFKTSGGLRVYNLGVLVRTYSADLFGVAGEVVSRQRLLLNFARNDVITSKCPVWREIRKTLDKQAGRRRKSKAMTDNERLHACRQLASAQCSVADLVDAPILTDVRGRHWSLNKLFGANNYQIQHKYKQKLSVADKGDLRGCSLMESCLAFVLSTETLDRLRMSLPELRALTRPLWLTTYRKEFGWEPTPLKSLVESMPNDCQELPPSGWTETENVWASIIGSTMYQVCQALETQYRQVVISAGPGTAWTDGVRLIGLNREFLKDCELGLKGVIRVCTAALDALCFDKSRGGEGDDETSLERFYQSVQDLLPEMVVRALSRMESSLAQVGRRLTRKQLAEQDRLKRLSAGVEKIAAGSDNEEDG